MMFCRVGYVGATVQQLKLHTFMRTTTPLHPSFVAPSCLWQQFHRYVLLCRLDPKLVESQFSVTCLRRHQTRGKFAITIIMTIALAILS